MNKIKDTALYTAVVTPFLSGSLQLDLTTFAKLLREQEKAANGVVILGSTGEGLALSETEKRELVRFTASQKLSVPVLVGISGFQLPQTLDFLQFCESQNIDGYLMPVPLYAKPGLEGQFAWFQSLLNAVRRPCMIYNVPSRAGVKLHAQALARIATHPNAWAVKEASGSIEELNHYRAAAPNLQFYCGDDALLPAFVKNGAVGLVSVAANVWPNETQRYTQFCLQGKELPALWSEACNSLFLASNPVPVKVLMQQAGLLPIADVRAPLSLKDLVSTEPLLKNHTRIQAWHASL